MTRAISGPKRIEFLYNRRDKEIIIDRDGSFPSYEPGDIVERRGRCWIAKQVLMQQSLSGPQTQLVQVVKLVEN